MTRIINWPTNILRGLFSHNLTIFFGAGISKEFGFPLWNEFIDTLRHEISLPDAQKTIADIQYNSDKKMDLIQTYFDNKQEETVNLLMSEFKKDIPHSVLASSNEALLLKLNAGSYITTNIDNSLDAVKGPAGKMRAQIFWYNQNNDIRAKVISKEYKKDPLIIRLHGSLNDTAHLVFSRDQYTKIENSNSFVMTDLLPALFVTTTVLFVGYSINDPDVQAIIKKAYSKDNLQNNLFILNTSSVDVSYDLKNMGVKSIPVHYPDINDQASALKKSLQELVTIQNHFETPEGYSSALNIINSGENSRIKQLQNIIY